MSKPTEQQVRDVLEMLRESSIVEMENIVYFSREWDDHKVAMLHRFSGQNEIIEALKLNGDIGE